MKWAILNIIFRVNHTAHQWPGTTTNLITESKSAIGVDVDVLCPNLSLRLQIIVLFRIQHHNMVLYSDVPALLVRSKAACESFPTLTHLVILQVYIKIVKKNIVLHWHMYSEPLLSTVIAQHSTVFLGLMLCSPGFWIFWHSPLQILSNSVRCFIFVWKSEPSEWCYHVRTDLLHYL